MAAVLFWPQCVKPVTAKKLNHPSDGLVPKSVTPLVSEFHLLYLPTNLYPPWRNVKVCALAQLICVSLFFVLL